LYWWLDEDSLADLNDARQTNSTLPPKPPAIYFDKTYGQ
jgi:hypothetical protein